MHQDGVIDISGAEDEAGTSSPTAGDNLASGYYRCGDACLTNRSGTGCLADLATASSTHEHSG